MKSRNAPQLMLLLMVAAANPAQSANDGVAQNHAAASQPSVTIASAPSGPIWLSYEIHGAPEVGQAVEIEIVVVAALPFTSVTVEAYTHDGLIVTPVRSLLALASVEIGEPMTTTLTVTPFVEGPLRVALLALGEFDGTIQAGQLTIPFQVGPLIQETRSGELNTTTTVEKVISLPAREN